MLLVWGKFLRKNFATERPDGGCDMMYCFTALQAAFRRKDALESALKGNYGDWRNFEWLPPEEADESANPPSRRSGRPCRKS